MPQISLSSLLVIDSLLACAHLAARTTSPNQIHLALSNQRLLNLHETSP